MKFGRILKALYTITTEIYPRNKRMAQELNAIHHTYRKKRGENMSISTDTEKVLDKIQNSFII